MLRKWVDDMAVEIENIGDAVAFAIFVFNRLEYVGLNNNFREVCQLYLDWRSAAERILRQSKHRVEELEQLYNKVDWARLVTLLQEELQQRNVIQRRHNELIIELKRVRSRIHF